MKLFKTKNETAYEKRLQRREQFVLWFFRWSQVLMIVFGLLATALFIFVIKRADLIIPMERRIALYVALGICVLSTVICFEINGMICDIQGKKKSALREQTGERVPSK